MITRKRSLSPEKARKVARIKAALAQSDSAIHDHMISLDTFERSAKRAGTGRVSGEWLRTFDKLQAELSRARARLADLNTGLRAENDLRRSLRDTAAAVGAWRITMGSSDSAEIAAASARMARLFDSAAAHGERGAARLERGV
jgi:hypothetical protein